ncbi:MAG: hypothetical protein AAF160_04590 [Pseudomonadota bacterium]
MLRILTGFFVLLLLAALVRDGIASLDAGVWTPVALGQWWAEIDRSSLLLLQPAIERHYDPALWEDVIQPLLETPAWQIAGVPAAFCWVLSLFFRSRKKKLDLSHRARF